MIFAKKVIIICKNGYRKDYTHVTEFAVHTHEINKIPVEVLLISGETDVANGRIIAHEKYPIKELHITIIDWYIPPE